MILSIKKKTNQVILFYLFVIAVCYCRYSFTSSVGNIILPLELLFILATFFTRDMKHFERGAILSTYFVFIIYRITSSVLINNELTSETRIIVYRELGVLLLMLAIVEFDTVYQIVASLKFVGVINAVFACVEYITKSNFTTGLIKNKRIIFSAISEHSSNWRVRTFFIHPVVCAVFITISWILLLYMPYKNRMVNYIAGVTMIIGIIGTKSRSSWVSFAIITSLFLLKRWGVSEGKKISKNSLYAFLVMLMLLIAFIWIFPDKAIQLVDTVINRVTDATNAKHASNYNRIRMIIIGIREWESFPMKNKIFGQGASYAINYLKAHPIRGWKIAVDNTYITTLMNYGLIGMALILAMIVECIHTFIITRSRICEMSALILISMFISGFFYEIHGWLTSTICMSLFCVIVAESSTVVPDPKLKV